MPFWDYVHFGRPASSAAGTEDEDDARQYRHLQEGLRQIGLQSCNILVQVNNTNNISYGRNASNVQYNNFSPQHGFGGGGGGGSGGRSSRGGRSGGHGDNGDTELSDVLIPSSAGAAAATTAASSSALGVIKGSTRNLFSHYRHRLSVSAARGQ